MKLKHKILILCFSFFIEIKAQNLVPNGSFETYSTCPDNFSQINKATPWYDPTGETSDYFNACDNGYLNVPFCGIGYQFSRTGVAYAGLSALNGFGEVNREYIQVKLNSALMQDSCYLVEFYSNLDNHTDYAINSLGAYLSNTAVSIMGPGSVMSYTPQIISTLFLTDTLNWMRIAGYYKANGGEQYITIGDFKPFSAGDTLYTGNGIFPGAYYYIDDVTVKKVGGCDTTLSVPEYNNGLLRKLYPNPNNGNMIFEYTIAKNEIGQLIIYDITGRIINKYALNNNSNALTISEAALKNGIYFYSVTISGETKANGKFEIIK